MAATAMAELITNHTVEPSPTPDLALLREKGHEELSHYVRTKTKYDALAFLITTKRQDLNRLIMTEAESSQKLYNACVTFFFDMIIPCWHPNRDLRVSQKINLFRYKQELEGSRQNAGPGHDYLVWQVARMRGILAIASANFKDAAFDMNLVKLNRAQTEAPDLTLSLLKSTKDYREFLELKIDRSTRFLENALVPARKQQYLDSLPDIADPFIRVFENPRHYQLDRQVMQETRMAISDSLERLAAARYADPSMARARNGRHSLTPEEEHLNSIPHNDHDHYARHVTAAKASNIIKDNGDMCLICHMDYVKGEDAVDMLACGHYFHNDCWKEWLDHCPPQQDGHCPYCRRLACWADRRKAAKQDASVSDEALLWDVVTPDGIETALPNASTSGSTGRRSQRQELAEDDEDDDDEEEEEEEEDDDEENDDDEDYGEEMHIGQDEDVIMSEEGDLQLHSRQNEDVIMSEESGFPFGDSQTQHHTVGTVVSMVFPASSRTSEVH